MIFITYNPTSPSQRHLVRLNNKHLKKKPLIKKNVCGLKNSSGRSNTGKITVRHRGGGHKKNYRKVDFFRNTVREGIVCSIEYDPCRNALLAAVYSREGREFYYIIAPTDLQIGDIVKAGSKIAAKIGFSLPLSKIPEGCLVHNVSTKIGGRAQIARAAGAYAVLAEKPTQYSLLRLSSSTLKRVQSACYATVGAVSNRAAFLTRLGKAGNSRWLNVRPGVRGVAMNPVDHPHGGGEGKKSGSSKTPWGKPAKRVASTKIKHK